MHTLSLSFANIASARCGSTSPPSVAGSSVFCDNLTFTAGDGYTWHYTFDSRGNRLTAVAPPLTGQYTGERLLALEQMAVGGVNTVRGYRENQLVRDRAVVASLEFRVPLLFNKAGAGILELAPFFDFGGGWDVHEDRHPETIASTGIGLTASTI